MIDDSADEQTDYIIWVEDLGWYNSELDIVDSLNDATGYMTFNGARKRGEQRAEPCRIYKRSTSISIADC